MRLVYAFAALILLSPVFGCVVQDNSVESYPRSGPCSSESFGGIACGSFSLAYTGRVDFEANGRLVKQRKYHIFAGIFVDGARTAGPKPLDFTISSNGNFSLRVGGGFSEREVCQAGNWTTSKIYDEVHLIFRARGCDDKHVVCKDSSCPRIVTMQCLGANTAG